MCSMRSAACRRCVTSPPVSMIAEQAAAGIEDEPRRALDPHARSVGAQHRYSIGCSSTIALASTALARATLHALDVVRMDRDAQGMPTSASARAPAVAREREANSMRPSRETRNTTSLSSLGCGSGTRARARRRRGRAPGP
jgi:hypothetical protein